MKKSLFTHLSALALIVALFCCTMASASAATFPPITDAPPPITPEQTIPDTEEPTTKNGLFYSDTGFLWNPERILPVTNGADDYLYWAEQILDDKPIVVIDDNGTYIGFHLSKISQLDKLNSYCPSWFSLEGHLAILEEFNDLQRAIWEQPRWRSDGTTIASYLTPQNAAKVKQMDNAYDALVYITSTAEYVTTERLRQDVDYHLSCLHKTADEVTSTVNSLSQHSRPTSTNLESTLIAISQDSHPSEVITTARQFLKDNPLLHNLALFNEVRLSMPTSNTLHMQTLGTEKIDALYDAVCTTFAEYAPDALDRIQNYLYIVPIDPTSLTPVNLPTGATGN